MLINLSNHPAAGWGKEQLEAAAVYGEIIDFPFPSVDPCWTEDAIAQLASDVVDKIINTYGTDLVVHLMGEFTLAFAAIKKFNEKGIPCIASCSQRDVETAADGSKIVRFHFTRFRKYL